MFKLFRKWWNYLTAKLTGSFNERADPKVQLEQAITEAQTQHVRLKEQAANVIANQKQSEIRLNGKLDELEKLNANARQALIMAADAEKAGDAAKAAQYNSAAETIANQLIQVEKDVESLKTLVLESAQASDQAKAAVAAELANPAGEDRREVEAPVAARPGEDAGRDELGDGPAQRVASAATSRRSKRSRRRSRRATPRPRRPRSSTRPRSSPASSKSSRRRRTSRPTAGSASCAQSSASTRLPPPRRRPSPSLRRRPSRPRAPRRRPDPDPGKCEPSRLVPALSAHRSCRHGRSVSLERCFRGLGSQFAVSGGPGAARRRAPAPSARRGRRRTR